ncbi:MAG: hypothetical protein DMD35_21450 [Gemmatimonadetes bacterium]|nr:MAG: hypothetical protein DMD35_21450 [Gemmatimonadota bacterium]
MGAWRRRAPADGRRVAPRASASRLVQGPVGMRRQLTQELRQVAEDTNRCHCHLQPLRSQVDMRLIRYLQLCFAIVCSLTLLPRPLSAQEAGSNVSARSAADEYLAESGLDDVGRFALRMNERVLVDQMAKGDTGRVRDSVRAFAARYVTWDSIRNEAVRLLTEDFTEQELRDMLAFLLSRGGSVYATAITVAARLYANSDLPVDTVRWRFGRALDDIRPTEKEAAEIRRFTSTSLGQKFIRLPLEIVMLGNREFLARLRPRLPILRTMIGGAISVDRPREVDLSQSGAAVRDGHNTAGQPYFEFKLDSNATLVPGTLKLDYPDSLRKRHLGGAALLQWVVDTTGRVRDGSIKVVSSTHPLVTQAILAALANARFRPARAGGRNVAELVEMPFLLGLEAPHAAPPKVKPTARVRARP